MYKLFNQQDLKIESEPSEAMDEDDLDLMLPAKKKKSKKVDFDEGELLEKDEGKLCGKKHLCPLIFS